ncbi:MAG: glutathione binding-like protein, partial [bacterium]
MGQAPCLELDSVAITAEIAAIARGNLENLDGWIEGQEFRCGDRFTRADILLYSFLDFAGMAGSPLGLLCKHITAGRDRLDKDGIYSKASFHVMEAGGHERPRSCT